MNEDGRVDLMPSTESQSEVLGNVYSRLSNHQYFGGRVMSKHQRSVAASCTIEEHDTSKVLPSIALPTPTHLNEEQYS